MRAAFLLSAAFQAAYAAVAVTERAEETIDATSRIEAFLKAHENDNPGNWANMTTQAEGIEDNPVEVRSLQARAAGNAILANKCYYDIWVWDVDQNGQTAYKLPARSKKTRQFRQPCNGCGVSMKVSRTSSLQAGKHTQFEYSIANGIIYFDISYVDCAKGSSAANCPGHESGHSIVAKTKSLCGSFYCKSGKYCPTQAYYVDKPLEKLGIPEPVKGCGGNGYGMDIYFKMCTDNKNLGKRVAGRIDYEDDSDIDSLREVGDDE